MQQKFLSVEEAAQFLGLKKSTLYKKAHRRELPHYKVGKLLRFKEAELIEWIEATRVATR